MIKKTKNWDFLKKNNKNHYILKKISTDHEKFR